MYLREKEWKQINEKIINQDTTFTFAFTTLISAVH